MEGEYYSERHDSHVHGESQVGKEGSFICAVVATIAVDVIEEKGAQ